MYLRYKSGVINCTIKLSPQLFQTNRDDFVVDNESVGTCRVVSLTGAIRRVNFCHISLLVIVLNSLAQVLIYYKQAEHPYAKAKPNQPTKQWVTKLFTNSSQQVLKIPWSRMPVLSSPSAQT